MAITERWFADETRWRRAIDGLVRIYRERRDVMLDALAEHMPADATWTTPAGGFFVWVTLPPWADTRASLAAAVERRVAYVPGTAFYPDGRGANELRLAFCYPPEDRIREGVARLGALLREEAQLYRSMEGE
jgi:DNA-binding transcriptional MocR family regulator